MRSTIDRALLMLIVSAVGLGCASQAPPARRQPRPLEPLEVRLARAKSLWESRGVSSYLLDVKTSCFCPPTPPFRITVQDGEIVKILRVRENGFLEDVPVDAGPAITVERLFELARTGEPPRNASFDETLGYPVSVSLGDWSRDTGFRYEVLSLTPLR